MEEMIYNLNLQNVKLEIIKFTFGINANVVSI